MYVRRLFCKFLAPAGEGEGGSGGTPTPEESQAAAIATAVEAATKGLKSKNQELLNKLHTAGDALKAWEGLDPAAIRGLMDRMDGDEELKLLKDGKLDDVVQRRVAKRDADWQKKLDIAAAERDSEKNKTSRFFTRVLDEQIRAAVNGKVHEKAVDDALFRARTIFTLDEDGYAVQLQNGQPVIGKDGKTPFSPQEWIESMRENAPHWFPSTASGSGAGPSKGGGGANLMNLPPIERMNAARQGKK
jgi:hypothetical protein